MQKTGNPMETVVTSMNPWKNYGKKHLENHGKPWKNYGTTMEKIGTSIEKPWKINGKPWKTMENPWHFQIFPAFSETPRLMNGGESSDSEGSEEMDFVSEPVAWQCSKPLLVDDYRRKLRISRYYSDLE